MKLKHTSILFLLAVFVSSCKQDPTVILNYNSYPKAVGDIILTKCATKGCHNDVSKDAAAGLSLSSWDKLFEGARAGSSVIPYRPDQSFLLFFINTYADLGLSQIPTMPLNQEALSRDEVLTIKNWIISGAPNDQGFVKFSDNPQRKKYYVLNSKCKLVTVFDKETKLIMRYIDAGTDADGVPCSITVSPDNNYWYVLFTAENAGSSLKKFRASDDQLVSSLSLNSSVWKTLKISSDSKKALIADTKSNSNFIGGSITMIDLNSMKVMHTFEAPKDSLCFPMGMEVNKDFSKAYSASFHSNYFYKIDLVNNKVKKIRLNPNEAPVIDDVDDSYNPVQILLSPDESEYFVLCARSHEIRFYKTSNDSLLQTISVGFNPLEMKVSEKNDYLFVSDTSIVNSKKGSIYVIDYKNRSFIKNIDTGNQPQGMAIDEEKGLIYVANRNTGGATHHTTNCEGNAGTVTIIDMNTLELVSRYKTEVSVEPISVSIRY